MIKNGRFNKGFLASCDAVALYPSIMVEEGLEILQQKISKDGGLKEKTDLDKTEVMELARLCTENPYFECDQLGFFSQSKGAHMGGPLSRLLADLIIENKIEKVIKKHQKWKKIWDWVRLIDDTLSAWESEDTFLEFFDYLNTIHPGIKWTKETEIDGKLAIFDILIIREEGGFQTTVYRKSTASDRYIHYTSSQAWKEKVCALKTLKNRAHVYCSNEKLLLEELSHLADIFVQNGYPATLVHRILFEEKEKKKTSDEEIDFQQTFFAPYHPRARKLFKILEEKFDITPIYKKTRTLGDLLMKKCRGIDKQFKKNTVYKVPCSSCPVSYIGQSKNSLKTRMGQHKQMCKPGWKKKIMTSNKKDNGLAYHHHKTGHDFDFDNVQILTQENNYWRRLIREGININTSTKEKLANLQAGFEIDACWQPFLTGQSDSEIFDN
jgi:hypothetical protein